MNADDIKARVASYFRYRQQCPLVAFEASGELKGWSGEPSDVLVVTKTRLLYEIEVKLTISDLKHDQVKSKHQTFRNGGRHPVQRFFFAVPEGLAVKAHEVTRELYPYAGILSVDDNDHTYPEDAVSVFAEARLLLGQRLSTKQLVAFIKAQSATLCRLAAVNSRLAQFYAERSAEVKELKKALELQKAINSALQPQEPVKSFEEVFGE